MTTQANKGIRDFGFTIGEMRPGPRNAITDVAGVKVGHTTLDAGSKKTGVTAVLPHTGNLFKEKVTAGVHVINGFGKSAGFMQIQELGVIETPIILTNTLSVGVAFDALVSYMLAQNDDIGRKAGTVNPVICECNDGYLNDIRAGFVKKEHVLAAIKKADSDFAQGAVGAGTGMSCYGLKGGIGSSSRAVKLDGDTTTYYLGVLVLSNFGVARDLHVDGHRIGKTIAQNEVQNEDKGSVIVIIATDIPLLDRQLTRIARRGVVGLTRTGSFLGHSSGDFVLAFSSANRIYHYNSKPFFSTRGLCEGRINQVFRATAEATEEAVLNSLVAADGTTGRCGHKRESLRDYFAKSGQNVL